MGKDIIIEEEGKGGIILYQAPDGQTSLEVKLENETVWLTRQQMAILFDRDVKTIGKHVNNALREELAGEPVVAKFATPKKYGRREGFEQTQYPEYYSLEMITSVGFRVKSRNGIIFRRWANSVLKDYLIKGYAVKNNLIQERYNELKALVDTMGRTLLRLETGADEQVRSIFDVVRDYTYALDTL
ncbi:MAG: virulence RhuM family protein, partial [Bacteroidales bacterium]|nr:virulence RhuM family protein [Candidatus Egerieousia equi]